MVKIVLDHFLYAFFSQNVNFKTRDFSPRIEWCRADVLMYNSPIMEHIFMSYLLSWTSALEKQPFANKGTWQRLEFSITMDQSEGLTKSVSPVTTINQRSKSHSQSLWKTLFFVIFFTNLDMLSSLRAFRLAYWIRFAVK